MKTRILIAIGALSLNACVSTSTHEQALQKLQQQQEMNQQLTEHSMRLSEQQSQCAQDLSLLQVSCKQIQTDLEQSQTDLRQARQDVWLMSRDAEKANTTAWKLEQQIKSLQKLEDEIRKRNAIYKDFAEGLKQYIDSGELSVRINQGRLVLQLPEALLFPSGSATLNRKGYDTLKQISQLIKLQTDRHFQIEGHTDNIPISTSRYPSNWELSSARALTVVHVMVQEGVVPAQVSAAGFGEYHPIGDNTTPDGRKLNRRIEIIMQANVDLLADDINGLPENNQSGE